MEIGIGNEFGATLGRHGIVRAWGFFPYTLGSRFRFWRWPKPIPGLRHVRSIAVGGSHILARRGDGTVLEWGDPDDGDGTTIDRPTPVAVATPPLERLFVGDGTVHAFTVDGRHLAWGANLFRAICDGTAIDRLAPVEIRPRH